MLSSAAQPLESERLAEGRVDVTSASRSASDSGSSGGTRYPVTPSHTVYLIPPTSAPITGVPHAIDSSGVRPNGSYQGVVTKTSAAL